MSVFRPSNINRRLVGTATTATGGSPGNGGVIGKEVKPYCFKKEPVLGQQCYCGGCCAGIFRSNESYCGVKECCKCPTFCNFGGNLILKSGGTAWIVAPSSSEVSRTWYSRNDAVTTAQQVTGCTGWFVPSCGNLQNPGYTCRTYWDCYSPSYWSSTDSAPAYAWGVRMTDGSAFNNFHAGGTKSSVRTVRAFRLVSY